MDPNLIDRSLDSDFWRVELLESTASTNEELLSRARAGEREGAVLIAQTQTAGKGRGEKRFFSPAHTGLYLSFLLRESAQSVQDLTALCGVCAAQSIEALLPDTRVQIKWVNDLYVRDRKIAGILAQGTLNAAGKPEYAVVGIGINVYQPREGFPQDLTARAGFLAKPEEPPFLREALAGELLNRILKQKDAQKSAILSEYRKRDCLNGKRVFLPLQNQSAVACGIAEDFSLILRLPDNTKTHLHSGTVLVETENGKI